MQGKKKSIYQLGWLNFMKEIELLINNLKGDAFNIKSVEFILLLK